MEFTQPITYASIRPGIGSNTLADGNSRYMNVLTDWGDRVDRWRDKAEQWLHLRRKDLAWVRGRAEFREGMPQILGRHQWIFIVGCNNSGTTLIHDVLAASGHFSYMAHEGHRYTDVLRRAGRVGHERVWTEYLADLRLDGTAAIDQRDRLVFDWIYELPSPAKEKILEKTTVNAVRMLWLQRAFPNSAFIGVVRNGYAVAEGIKRKGKKSVERGASHWARVNAIMAEDAGKVDRFLLVRYEDFVGMPEATLGRLATFLSIPEHDLCEGFDHINRSPTASSNVAIQDMNARSIERLSPAELVTIRQCAEPQLSLYGYEQRDLS